MESVSLCSSESRASTFLLDACYKTDDGLVSAESVCPLAG